MRWTIPILSGILALGGWLRFAPLAAKSLWLDEAISAHDLGFPLGQAFRKAVGPGPLHPPLYSLALRLWALPFGTSEVALRSLAAMAGTATILGLYLLVIEASRLGGGNERDGRGGALLAAALVAVSPMQIELSQFIRGYTLAAACLIFGTWAALVALNRRRRSDPFWGLSALLLAASCYTHNLAILSVGSLGLYVAAVLALRNAPATTPPAGAEPMIDLGPGRRSFEARGALLAFALFGVVYLAPWLPSLMRQGEQLRTRSLFRGPSSISRASAEVAVAMLGTPDAGWIPPTELTLLVVEVLLAAFALLAIRRWPGDVFWVQAGLVPVLLVGGFSAISSRSIFAARYLSFTQIFWLAGVAVVAVATPTRLGKAGLGLALLGISAASCHQSWKSIGPAAKPGIRAAVRFVEASRRADEPVVVQSPFVFFGAAYYARTSRPRLCVDESRRNASFGLHLLAPHEKVPVSEVVALRAPGVWLIDNDAYKPSLAVRFPVPSYWAENGIWRFEQDRYLEKPPVIVRHYRIRTSSR